MIAAKTRFTKVFLMDNRKLINYHPFFYQTSCETIQNWTIYHRKLQIATLFEADAHQFTNVSFSGLLGLMALFLWTAVSGT